MMSHAHASMSAAEGASPGGFRRHAGLSEHFGGLGARIFTIQLDGQQSSLGRRYPHGVAASATIDSALSMILARRLRSRFRQADS